MPGTFEEVRCRYAPTRNIRAGGRWRWELRRRSNDNQRARDGGDLADTAADAEIVGIDHFAVGFNFLAFDADIGNPMLAAGIGAAGDVKAELFLIVGETIFELLCEPASVGLGFGEGEFAEFGAGAGDGAANEGGRFDGEAGVGEFTDNRGDMGFGDVDEEEILHGSIADVAIAVAFSEIGDCGAVARE